MARQYRFLLILLFCLGSGQAQSEVDPLFVEQVAPGVFVHFGEIGLMNETNQGGTANIGFVIGEDSVAVIDSGGSARQGKRLLAAVRKQTDLPIAYVINTHGHPDHLFGNVAFEEERAVRVGHQNLRGFLAARGEFYLRSFSEAMGEALVEESRILPPDEEVSGERLLDLGGRQLQVLAWQRAHSDSDVTVLDRESGTLFAGDLLFVDHIPVIDGSLLGFLAVMEKMAELPVRQVIPGHGPLVGWPDGLKAQRDYLEILANDLRTAIAAGTPLASAVENVGLEEARGWTLHETYHQRNATTGYVELEWE